uniref:ATP-grasp domain-containing protein n=2 Tax=unclassified Prevotella TaxID=2638335 RepID=A0AB33IXV2_9BACT
MIENKFVIFCPDHFNPLGVVRSLGEMGIKPDVILISETPSLVNNSNYVNVCHIVKDVVDGYNLLLREYGYKRDKVFLLATSDDVEAFLDKHYLEIKDSFIFYNSGEQGRVSHMMNKNVIIDMASACGLRVPKTELVRKGELPLHLGFPVLTKAPISTIHNWKSNVFICHNAKELEEAYTHINLDKIVLQEYIEKRTELNYEGFAINDGKDVYISLDNQFIRTTSSSFGNYFYLERNSHPELIDKIQNLIRLTRFNGIFEIEFLVGVDEQLYFLEINFRNSAWIYAYTSCGVNLPYMWAVSTLEGKLNTSSEKITKLPFKSMDELTDFKWSVLSGQVNFFVWLRQLWNVDSVFYYNKKDPKPFFSYLFFRLKGYFQH